MQEISLLRLFLIFLKIGTTAFGGNIALVAAIRKDICEKRKLLSDEQILDFTTLGNILPGPLATNVIAACGYAIRGMAGAIVGLIGIILPALILICALTEAYFRYGESPVLLKIFGGLLPGVAAVIAATAWSLAKKNVSNPLQVFIILAAGTAILLLQGFLITLFVIIISGLIGFLFFNENKSTIKKTHIFLSSLVFLVFIWFIIFFNRLRAVMILAVGKSNPLLIKYLIILLLLSIFGLIVFLFFRKKSKDTNKKNQVTIPITVRIKSQIPFISLTSLLLIGLIFFLIHPASLILQELRMLGLTFGSMSVTLFGGGYVFIPAIEKVVVGLHHWVTSKEFADGIAMGQVTPGPVAITASFVGYRVAGIWGAIVSAIAIFVPPAFVMVLAQQFIDKIKGRPAVIAVFKGVRPAVIGMIIASVWVIGKSAPHDWQSGVIFGIIFIVSVWKNYDTAILIPVAGLLGYLLHLF